MAIDDVLILKEVQDAAGDSTHPGHEPARRLAQRDHHKLVYSANQSDLQVNPDAAGYVVETFKQEFPNAVVWRDQLPPKHSGRSFPVLMHDGRVINSTSLSEMIATGLNNAVDYVFVDREHAVRSEGFLKNNLKAIIEPREEEADIEPGEEEK